MFDDYAKLGIVEKFCKEYRDFLKQEVAERGPIPHENHELKLIETQRENLHPVKSWPILADSLSEDELAEAVTISKTKAMSAVMNRAEKGKKKAAKESIMADLEKAGAVSKQTINQLRKVKREKETSE